VKKIQCKALGSLRPNPRQLAHGFHQRGQRFWIKEQSLHPPFSKFPKLGIPTDN
jgi:hypothetical protein